MEKKIYILENLGCANCAAKIEQKISRLPGVSQVTLTYATKQLRLTAENPDALLPEIQKIANSLEPEILVVERRRSSRSHASTDEAAHHHEHGEACSCGHDHEHHHEHSHEHHHDHGEACSCGHDHEHHHEHSHEHHHDHGEACSCGHDHEHHHEHSHEHHHDHGEACSCGHDHEHHHEHSHEIPQEFPDDGRSQKIYTLENLGCANCAAKMEKKIRELPGVHYASITYATKQLRLSSDNPEALLPQIQNICSSIEPEVVVKDRERRQAPVSSSDTALSRLSGHGKEIALVAGGALLFIAGEILEHFALSVPSLCVLVAAYIILGGKVVLTALRNIGKGQIFDENFLMSVATLGAFAIREYPEAVGVMLFYRIGELFEEIAVEKSRTQIMEAVDLRPEVVNLSSGSEVQVIPAEEARVGDLLLVRPGDRIPLDGVVVEGESRIDTSPVTGEPVPVRAAAGDPVISGCVNTSGLLKIRVEKVLEESMVTRILDSVENAAASKPKIDRFITRFSRIYTPVVVFLALGTAILPSLATGNWNYWVYTALSFLVMSCPCALVLSVPLAFFSGIGAGSKKGILFKGGVSLEAMADIKAVVMDKTGTITEGNFILQKSVPCSSITEDQLLTLCAACELSSTHPIGASILGAAKERGLAIPHPEAVEEIAGCGIRAKLDEGEVLCGNRKLMEKYNVSLENYQNAGFGTEVLAAKDGVFLGYLLISDTVKSGTKAAIASLKRLGITTAMLTGDAKDSAQAVGRETGIDEVHAKLLPQDKLKKLGEIRSQHGRVMFVGDGINDAPVLAGADVGAAMGSGADAAIEAADAVFMTSDMAAIPQSLDIARRTKRIAWQNVVFALAVKVLVMLLGLMGYASMWLAVFADTGVAILCILNSIRILYRKL